MVSHWLIKNLSLTKKNLWWVPMTKAALRAAYGEEFLTAERYGKHKLDELDPARVAKHLLLFRPGEAVVEDVMVRARLAIPGLTATSEILRILRFNRDCMFAVARKSKFDPAAPAAEGFIAMLPLNERGLLALALDALNRSSPDTKFLAPPGERPAGI
jgi:hypothetical protein